MARYRNRIKCFMTVNARDIRENEQNFRSHGQAQTDELTALLEDVGMVDVLKVVETEDGELVLVDGHLRRELIGSGTVQVAVLDLDELETKRVLAHFDQIGTMAEVDNAALDALMAEIAATPPPDLQEQDITDALSVIAETPEHFERDSQRAQQIAATASRCLQQLADNAPQTLAEAQAVIVPHEGSAVLVISDPDLSDIVMELRERHEAGETHLLDRLFACIWDPNDEAST